jgi:flagellar hook-associated protein 2
MGVSLSGLGSGFDWQSVIEQLGTVENQRLTPLNTQKSNYQAKLKAWESLTTALENLNSAAADLKDSSDFSVFGATLTSSSSVSADSLVSVTTGSGATPGSYSIVVSNMARAEKLRSATTYADSTTALGKTGTLNINSVDVTLDGTESLADLRDKINDADAGVTASIVQSGTNQYNLVMTSKTEGAAGISLTDLSGEDMIFSETPLQDGEDASFTVDGLTITSSTNKVTNAIPGVTLTIRGEDPSTTVGLSIDTDTEAITEKIQAFADAYNNVLSFISDQTTYDAANDETGGPLFSDSTLKRVKNTLQNLLSGVGLNTTLGLSMESDNSLSLDSTQLSSLLKDGFDETVEAFNSLSVKFAESIERFTDDIDGSITIQKNSLETSIKNVDKKIETTQDFIDRKMEMLTNQFITLDSALYEMQNMSSYIASQLSSLSSSS